MVSGQTRRMCGSSAIYSSQAKAGTNNTSIGPLVVSTNRFAGFERVAHRTGSEEEQAQSHRAAAIAAAQTQIAQGQQHGDDSDKGTHDRAHQESRRALLTCCRAERSSFLGRGPRRDDLEVHRLPQGSCRLDPNRHIRTFGIRALPCGPRVREDRRDPLRFCRRELRDRKASLREQRFPISRSSSRGRVTGFPATCRSGLGRPGG